MAALSPKRFRLLLVAGGLAALCALAFLLLSALEENLVFFKSPSELAANPPAAGERLRIGGLVAKGSLRRDGTRVRFRVTDGVAEIAVRYDGLLPDLIREGQGVVAEGHLMGGGFVADTVLAKHDENYMPPEIAAALRASGQWQGAP